MPPEFAIIQERDVEGLKVVEIDTKKASYQGKAWLELGDYGKRKWENMLVLSRSKERLKILYV